MIECLWMCDRTCAQISGLDCKHKLDDNPGCLKNDKFEEGQQMKSLTKSQSLSLPHINYFNGGHVKVLFHLCVRTLSNYYSIMIANKKSKCTTITNRAENQHSRCLDNLIWSTLTWFNLVHNILNFVHVILFGI